MATLQDIADRLNISKGTVSKALNGAPDISETLQKTVLETAVEMGYTKIRRQKAADEAPAPEASDEVKLLTEIRDALAQGTPRH